MAFQHNAQVFMVPPTAQYGTKRQKKVLCEFPVAGIRVRIREGTVDHILEKHSKDFDFAIDGESNFLSILSPLFPNFSLPTDDRVQSVAVHPRDHQHVLSTLPLSCEEYTC